MYEMNPAYKRTRNSNKYQCLSLKVKDLINIISNCSVISWPMYEMIMICTRYSFLLHAYSVAATNTNLKV